MGDATTRSRYESGLGRTVWYSRPWKSAVRFLNSHGLEYQTVPPDAVSITMPGTRYLGIDYGTRRVGLAISDPDGTIASPLLTLPWPGSARKCAAAILARVAEDYDVDEFVVGLPLYMHGGEGKQTDPVKQLAREIEEQSERPVHFWDERLTTRAAEVALNAAGLTRAKKKARVDQVAAQIMLQSFLDCRQQKDTS